MFLSRSSSSHTKREDRCQRTFKQLLGCVHLQTQRMTGGFFLKPLGAFNQFEKYAIVKLDDFFQERLRDLNHHRLKDTVDGRNPAPVHR